MTQHKKACHVKLVCLLCHTSEEFPDKKSLSRHNIQVHQVCRKSWVFLLPGKNQLIMYIFYIHLIDHQERINCTECSFSTKHKTALQRHKVRFHKISNGFCLFPSLRKSIIIFHPLQETVHEGKRNFSCSMQDCEKDFTRKEYLLQHHKKDHILAA